MFSRRSFLLASAAALPLAEARPALAEPPAPGTLALPHRIVDGPTPMAADFPVTHLAVTWTGATEAGVRLRTKRGWGSWQGLQACPSGRDGEVARFSSVLSTSGAIGYEVAGARGRGSALVSELNTAAAPSVAADRFSVADRSAFLPYLNRAAWHADESLRFNAAGQEIWPPVYIPVQTLSVHHTAGINNDPDPAATVRAIYHDHAVNRGNGDHSYHLFIDEAGRVYEARNSGTDLLPVFGTVPGPDGRLPMVNGGHIVGWNAGNVGIVLLGNFQTQQPTQRAYRSLVYVLAVLSALCKLDPLGTTDYVNPISGAKKTVDTISGHRDWAATDCPGHAFYPRFPTLRQDVADVLPG